MMKGHLLSEPPYSHGRGNKWKRPLRAFAWIWYLATSPYIPIDKGNTRPRPTLMGQASISSHSGGEGETKYLQDNNRVHLRGYAWDHGCVCKVTWLGQEEIDWTQSSHHLPKKVNSGCAFREWAFVESCPWLWPCVERGWRSGGLCLVLPTTVPLGLTASVAPPVTWQWLP